MTLRSSKFPTDTPHLVWQSYCDGKHDACLPGYVKYPWHDTSILWAMMINITHFNGMKYVHESVYTETEMLSSSRYWSRPACPDTDSGTSLTSPRTHFLGQQAFHICCCNHNHRPVLIPGLIHNMYWNKSTENPSLQNNPKPGAAIRFVRETHISSFNFYLFICTNVMWIPWLTSFIHSVMKLITQITFMSNQLSPMKWIKMSLIVHTLVMFFNTFSSDTWLEKQSLIIKTLNNNWEHKCKYNTDSSTAS